MSILFAKKVFYLSSVCSVEDWRVSTFAVVASVSRSYSFVRLSKA